MAETPIPPYAEEIDTFKRPLDSNKYRFDKSWIITPVGQRHLRGTPTVIAVQKLRAASGRGALVGKESNTVGQRWIVVTGLVPYEEQMAEYKKMFQDAGYTGDHDVPEYVGFLVQRGEVVPGAAEPAWEQSMMFSYSTTLVNRLQNWNVSGQEVVDVANTQQSLTSPLPQLAIAEWGDDVACPPEIKVLSREERDLSQGQVGGAGGTIPQRNPALGQQRRPVPGPQGFGPGPRPGDNKGGDELVAGGGQAAVAANPEAAANKQQEAPKYYLLRYFDFNVATGKQYAYRVFPILSNPNYNVDGKELVNMDQNQQQFLGLDTKHVKADPATGKVAGWQTVATYWSPGSRPARVSGDMRLLAGPVEPPRTSNPTEITGEVRILRWDEKTGNSMHGVRSDQFRGMVLDYPSVPMITPGLEGRTSVPVSTGCLLADLTGGEPLSPHDRDKIHSPGMMLVLDDTGNLVIHDEMAETKEWLAETKEPEQPVAGRNMGRPPMFRQQRPPTGRGPSNDPSLPNSMRGR